MGLMEGIQHLNELVTPLRLVSQWAHIVLQNRVHKLELWRQLGPAASIIFVIYILPRTYIFNYF
jgi:hypothetical protein